MLDFTDTADTADVADTTKLATPWGWAPIKYANTKKLQNAYPYSFFADYNSN